MIQPGDLRLAEQLLRRLHAEFERKSDAIQKLWKERDALRDELELQKALVAEAQAMTAKVCAENEALRADAERYRWLARKVSAHGICDGWQFGFPSALTLPANALAMSDPEKALGQCIDAARKEGK